MVGSVLVVPENKGVQSGKKKNFLPVFGNLAGRKVTPVSNNGTVCGMSWEMLFLITGIILWSLGAGRLANPQMALAGKCMVGIALAPLGLILCGICCCSPILDCLTDSKR